MPAIAKDQATFQTSNGASASRTPILVTGFGPFGADGAAQHNPAEKLALAVAKALDAPVVILPVSWERGLAAFQAAVAEHKPATVLNFGYARGVAGIQIETTARNVAESTKPDVDGVVAAGRLQVPDGPAKRTPAFEQKELEAAIKSAAPACNVRWSDDAGGYLCNWIFYAGLSYGPIGQFLHVGEHVGGDVEVGAIAAAKFIARQGQ